MQLVIVTGLSGSGKSVVLRVLEDSHYYCLDNLPAVLLPEVVAHLLQEGQQYVAVSIDTRSSTLPMLPQQIERLRDQQVDVRVLYLECSEACVIRRFGETRRPHPLSGQGESLEVCIRRERDMLLPVADLGHRVDTSHLSANTLRNWVRDLVRQGDPHRLTVIFCSFGFKNGVPPDVDFVFDVRCLPNPYYEESLKMLSGRDDLVIEYLASLPPVLEMLQDIGQFVEKWLDVFTRDYRQYLTVALGCTGGRHRSVFLVEQLAVRFSQAQHPALVRHRDLE